MQILNILEALFNAHSLKKKLKETFHHSKKL